MKKPISTSDDPLGGGPVDDAPLLSADEIAAAKQEARDLFLSDKRKAARKKVIEDEIARMKRADGQVTGEGTKDELVTITLDLAEHSDHLKVNGEPFWHGHTYTRPRHVVDSLREQMMRGWMHEDTVNGKSLEDIYRRRRMSVVNGRTGSVINAPAAIG